MSKTKWIIQRYVQSEYSREEQSRFNEWFVESQNESEKDAALQELWEISGAEADERTEKAYEETLGKLGLKRIRPFRKVIWKIAVAAAILGFGIISGISLSSSEQTETQLMELFVPIGEIRKVVLPDMSEVTLNGGSLLIYPEKFSKKERNVFLSGMGSFSVTKQEGKSFIVSTSDLQIEVLGTVFNVPSYADDPIASASLKEGRIRVRTEKDSQYEFDLLPGEQIRYNRLMHEVIKSKADLNIDFGWTDGAMYFNELSMFEIVKMAERRYGVRMHLASGKYADARITAKIVHGESFEEFLEILESLLPGMTYEEDGNVVYIR